MVLALTTYLVVRSYLVDQRVETAERQAFANARLARNAGVVASFSRALTESLSFQQSEDEFDRALGEAIASIYEASIS